MTSKAPRFVNTNPYRVGIIRENGSKVYVEPWSRYQPGAQGVFVCDGEYYRKYSHGKGQLVPFPVNRHSESVEGADEVPANAAPPVVRHQDKRKAVEVDPPVAESVPEPESEVIEDDEPEEVDYQPDTAELPEVNTDDDEEELEDGEEPDPRKQAPANLDGRARKPTRIRKSKSR